MYLYVVFDGKNPQQFSSRFYGTSWIKIVLIPDQNVKDLAEIPENVKDCLDIRPVKWIEEVLESALERMPQPAEEAQVSVADVAKDTKEVDVGQITKH